MPQSITSLAALSPVVKIVSPGGFRVTPQDVELFRRELSSFVPPDVFDAHAHLYDLDHVTNHLDLDASTRRLLLKESATNAGIGYELFLQQQRAWMGDRAPGGGLFFPFPSPKALDTAAANRFLLEELKCRPLSRGLMMIRPHDDPAEIEAQIKNDGWSGFKVYHVFADRPDTPHASIGEFLPDWAWEIAHQHELVIMLHIMRERSLADADNQQYINCYCRKYSGAKLVLAHAARGFCAHHTIEGIGAIAGLGNVYFDSSAICEAPALEAVLQTFGPTRLMYGSDFPISEAHGRAISVGDGFHWIYDWNHDEWPQGEPTLIGIESLLALKRACRSQNLNDSDIDLIFKDNARELLGLQDKSTPSRAQALYEKAKTLMPGGTQLLSKRPEMYAPGVWPAYAREARGVEIITHDGQRVLDFTTNGIGSCLLGFAHPEVCDAVLRRVRQGSMSTLNAPEEVELAERLVELNSWADQVRFHRGGGEALAAAVRIARAATGREVVAFCGYHGWQDWYLAANLGDGSGLTEHLLPGLEPNGVPRSLTGTILPFSYNELEALEEIVRTHGDRLAAVVMEPTRSADPQPGFLEGVKNLCDASGARLVFDEVTTGFRLHRVAAHLKYGVNPDIAVYAKALGNGHPVAAIVGRRDTMQAAQSSFISSTYWTEGIGPTAALATLKVLLREDAPAHIEEIAGRVRSGLASIAEAASVPLQIGGHPALTYFGFDHPDAPALATLWTTLMLKRGFLAGGAFYPSLAHRNTDVEEFLDAARPVITELGEAIAKSDIHDRLKTPVKHSGFARLN